MQNGVEPSRSVVNRVLCPAANNKACSSLFFFLYFPFVLSDMYLIVVRISVRLTVINYSPLHWKLS